MAKISNQLQISLLDWIINISFLVLPVIIAVVILIFTLRRKQIKLKELPLKARNVYAFLIIVSVDFVYIILITLPAILFFLIRNKENIVGIVPIFFKTLNLSLFFIIGFILYSILRKIQDVVLVYVSYFAMKSIILFISNLTFFFKMENDSPIKQTYYERFLKPDYFYFFRFLYGNLNKFILVATGVLIAYVFYNKKEVFYKLKGSISWLKANIKA